jgi:hypothetical protein
MASSPGSRAHHRIWRLCRSVMMRYLRETLLLVPSLNTICAVNIRSDDMSQPSNRSTKIEAATFEHKRLLKML